MKIKTNVRAGSGGSGSGGTQTGGHSSSPVYVPPIILARCLGVV